MKRIKLTQGKFALIDDEDFNFVNKYKWYVVFKRTTPYAQVKLKNGKHIAMHRYIMGETNPKIFIDHKNRKTLDNRKPNLRKCNSHQNHCNRVSSFNSTSKYLGVCWDTFTQRWAANIRIRGKQTKIGRFKNEKMAAKAYDKMAKKIHGRFANPNFK